MDLRRRLVANLSHLQAFETVARQQSFTRAGEELNLTQSAVSRQVAELEAQLGQALFVRIGRSVALTRAGERFLPEARELLAHSERTMMRALAGGAASSVLRLATLSTFGSRWLMPRLGRFLEAHPGTRAEIVSRDTVFDLDAEGVDVAIQFGLKPWPRASSSFFCRETVVPVAAPSMLARHPVGTAADLLTAPRLQLSLRARLWVDWFENCGLTGESSWSGHAFDRLSLLIEAARAGLGYALLPTYLIQSELASGALHIALPLPFRTPNAYYLVRPDSRDGDPLVDAFCRWIVSEVSEEGRAGAEAPRPVPDGSSEA